MIKRHFRDLHLYCQRQQRNDFCVRRGIEIRLKTRILRDLRANKLPDITWPKSAAADTLADA
jgi:hypothetical protein